LSREASFRLSSERSALGRAVPIRASLRRGKRERGRLGPRARRLFQGIKLGMRSALVTRPPFPRACALKAGVFFVGVGESRGVPLGAGARAHPVSFASMRIQRRLRCKGRENRKSALFLERGPGSSFSRLARRTAHSIRTRSRALTERRFVAG